MISRATSSFLFSLVLSTSIFAVPEIKDEKESRHELHAKALEGDLNAMYQLGTYYLLRREDDVSEKWFKKAALAKHIPSLWKWVGQLKRQPIHKAENNLRVALELLITLDELKAQFELAELYTNREAELFSLDIGKMYYEFSANAGEHESMLKLGHLFLGENDHPQDFVQAFQWFEKAANLEVAEGNRFLGMCYRYGLGTKKDLDVAWKYYGLGAKQGDLECAYTLAMALYKGEEVVQDKGLAKRYFEQAAKYGYRDSQLKLNNLIF